MLPNINSRNISAPGQQAMRNKLTTSHPKRLTIYSFHFHNDAWRAGQVGNIGVTEHDEPVPDNAWAKRGGDAGIRKWLDTARWAPDPA